MIELVLTILFFALLLAIQCVLSIYGYSIDEETDNSQLELLEDDIQTTRHVGTKDDASGYYN